MKAKVYYDRTASTSLRDELLEGGAIRPLVELARERHLMDLQLRGYPHTKRCWATLYCGLTKFLDVIEAKRGAFKLDAAEVYRKRHDKMPWGIPMSGEALRTAWSTVARYLEHEIRAVGERFTKEGAVQAMLCVNAGELFSVIDREVVIGYRDTAAKREVYQRLQDPLLDAVRGRTGPAWWKPPTRLGGELDLLAVDRAGRLLVMEVKPGSALSGIAWSPLQVTFYAELLREWATAVGDEVAGATLTRMLDQRVQLGLTDDPPRPLGAPLDIVPVIAIGGDVRPAATERLSAVQARLAGEGRAWPNLEVWRVRPGVRREDILLT